MLFEKIDVVICLIWFIDHTHDKNALRKFPPSVENDF